MPASDWLMSFKKWTLLFEIVQSFKPICRQEFCEPIFSMMNYIGLYKENIPIPPDSNPFWAYADDYEHIQPIEYLTVFIIMVIKNNFDSIMTEELYKIQMI